MEKKIFEPCELDVRAFADVITTSDYSGMKGEYDLEGNWIPFGGDGES